MFFGKNLKNKGSRDKLLFVAYGTFDIFNVCIGKASSFIKQAFLNMDRFFYSGRA